MKTNKRLWLYLWPACDKDCPYCCNKTNDLNDIPEATDLSQYDTIILTGGEPLITGLVRYIVQDVRNQMKPGAKLYMYTAKLDEPDRFKRILSMLDGMTITLHREDDKSHFIKLYDRGYHEGWFVGKSMRLKVFRHVTPPLGEVLAYFEMQLNIAPLDDCPLPQDGDFKRYTGKEDTVWGM